MALGGLRPDARPSQAPPPIVTAQRELLLPGGALVRLVPAHGDKLLNVQTVWADGRSCDATREANDMNVRQAIREQGYGVWHLRDEPGYAQRMVDRSLIDHELLHSLLARHLWSDGLSAPLRNEAGDPRPYVRCLWEETVVLTLQAALNGVRRAETESILGAAGLIAAWSPSTAMELELDTKPTTWRYAPLARARMVLGLTHNGAWDD